MTLILLFLSLFVVAVVTINCVLLALVVYLWRKWITALRALQVLNNGYQSIVLENAHLQALVSERIELLAERAELERTRTTKESEPLFVPNRSNTLH